MGNGAVARTKEKGGGQIVRKLKKKRDCRRDGQSRRGTLFLVGAGGKGTISKGGRNKSDQLGQKKEHRGWAFAVAVYTKATVYLYGEIKTGQYRGGAMADPS